MVMMVETLAEGPSASPSSVGRAQGCSSKDSSPPPWQASRIQAPSIKHHASRTCGARSQSPPVLSPVCQLQKYFLCNVSFKTTTITRVFFYLLYYPMKLSPGDPWAARSEVQACGHFVMTFKNLLSHHHHHHHTRHGGRNKSQIVIWCLSNFGRCPISFKLPAGHYKYKENHSQIVQWSS